MIVRSRAGDFGIVEYGGVTREVAFHLLPDAKDGDCVMIHAGFAIQKVDLQSAEEVWNLLRDIELTE